MRVWHGRELEEHLAEFATTVHGLLALGDWLEVVGVKQVALEATGVYWKPVWAVLEDRFELLLVNARAVKQVPGRKTDIKDAEWLCQLLEAGLLRASFVPPKPIRTLRNLTRYRKTQISDRQREANRLHKILEDRGIKLDCVASDILGVSGRAMLDALVSGTTDPEVLAELARGQLRKKIPALREALVGRFQDEHALIVEQILAHIDFLDEAIDRLSAEIEEQIRRFAAQRDLLMTIPGGKQRAAEMLIAEIGADMSAFPTPSTSPHGPRSPRATISPPASAARGDRGWGTKEEVSPAARSLRTFDVVDAGVHRRASSADRRTNPRTVAAALDPPPPCAAGWRPGRARGTTTRNGPATAAATADPAVARPSATLRVPTARGRRDRTAAPRPEPRA